ncbi:AsmA-like C-terminal domain-containing protein [Marivibrio halodurans]|uniref:AsmA-like C-terminal domain-containing protein n=1 Tax=Marivibrio halodurans TaxID=2039722 RepID=A0A8J7RY90_9PROT|nr:AsmA-like C-terminal domain-containing protein [Marivibrio halodurans]MBP5856952.1 AsmA-like C-terminal domain-containing protein [Marivibrio halodurans]
MKLHVRRLALEVLAFLVVGSLLLVGVAVWRLSSGPIALTFLTSTIEETLNQPGADYRVEIGDTQLTWAGWDRVVDLIARDVRLLNAEGAEIAQLPRLSVGFSLVDIGSGTVRPTSVDLLDAEVVLIRRTDGSLAFAINPEGLPLGVDAEDAPLAERVEGALLPPQIVDQIVRPPDGKGLLGGLTRIILTNARIWFDNRQSGRAWRGEAINAVIVRDAEGLEVSISGALGVPEGRATLSGTVTHDYGEDLFDVTLGLREAPVAIATRLFPEARDWLPIGERVGLDLGMRVDSMARPLSARVRWESERTAFSITLDDLTSTDGAPTRLIDGSFRIERLEPARLAGRVQALAPLSMLDAPVAGAGTFRLDRESGLEALNVSLTVDSGVLVLPSLYADGLVLYGGTADLGLERMAGGGVEASLRDLSIDLGGPRLTLAGTARLSPEDGLSAELDAMLADLPMERLDGLWPVSLAVDARNWVIPNIPRAEVDQATIGIALDLPEVRALEEIAAIDPETLPLDAVERFGGEIAFRDAEVDYLAPLTRAKEVDGRARYDLDRFDIDLFTGAVDDIAIETGRIEITGFQEPDQEITIDLDVGSPLHSALALLDTEPYAFVDALGLEAGTIDGRARTSVRFAFPLIDELTGDMVSFDATARLNDVRAPIPALDLEARGEKLDLWIDNRGLDLSGTVALNGMEGVLSWRENFASDAPVTRHMTLDARPDVTELARFGIDLPDVVTGPVGGRLDYKVARSGERRVSLAADLGEAAVALAPLSWSKPAGRAASLDVEAVFPVRGDVSVPFLRFAAEGPEGGMMAEGSLVLPPDFTAIRQARIERLAYGPHYVSGRIDRDPAGRYTVSLEGTSVDISGVLGEEDEAPPPEIETPEAEPPATATGTAEEDEEPGPPFDLTARFDRVVDDRGRAMENLDLSMRHDGTDIEALHLKGGIPEGGSLSLDYGPGEGAVRRLSIVSDNAGGALSTLDWTTRISGGALRVEGTREAPDAPMTGHATVENFTLQEAPVLAKLLEFMTLTGIQSALTQSGLPFERMEADFSYQDDRLSIGEARAYGSALGLTAEGEIDLARDYVTLQGTAAPMYSISRVIGAIPILGDILTAGGEGLFAANFGVEGPVEDPAVSVNPLSVLAPGFTRRLFGAPNPGDPDAPGAELRQGN